MDAKYMWDQGCELSTLQFEYVEQGYELHLSVECLVVELLAVKKGHWISPYLTKLQHASYWRP